MPALITVALAGLTLIGVGLAASRVPSRDPEFGLPLSRPRPPPSGSKVRQPALTLWDSSTPRSLRTSQKHHPDNQFGPLLRADRTVGDQLAAVLERERVGAIESGLMAFALRQEIVCALAQQQFGLSCRHLRCSPEVYGLIYTLLPSDAQMYRLAIWRGVRVVEVEGMVGWSLCEGGCPSPAREPWATERPGSNLRWS